MSNALLTAVMFWSLGGAYMLLPTRWVPDPDPSPEGRSKSYILAIFWPITAVCMVVVAACEEVLQLFWPQAEDKDK